MAVDSATVALISLLDNVPASEFRFIVEPALIPLLSAIASFSVLKNHGVTALIPLTESSCQTFHENDALVFLSRPTPKSIQLISQCVLANANSSRNVIITPENELSVPLLFTKYGVLGDIELHTWPVGFVPDAIEPDLLQVFDTNSVNDPNEGVWPLVWSLDWLQKHSTGAFGRVTAVGNLSQYIATLLKSKRAESLVKEQGVQTSDMLNLDSMKLKDVESRTKYANYAFGYSSSVFFGSSVEHVILIDRDLDLVTPLLSQTSYAGAVSEIIGIQASGTTKSGVRTSLKDDILFKSLSQMGFAEACESLHLSAKQLQEEYRLGNDLAKQETTIAEIRVVLNKLGSLQATQKLVDTHTELASIVMKDLETGTRRDAFELQMQILDNQITTSQAMTHIQDLIYRGASLNLVLRLLSLLCLVRDGIKENVLHAVFFGDLFKTYGYDGVKAYHYLQKRDLIYSPKSSSFLLSSAPFTSFTRFAMDSGSANTSSTDLGQNPASRTEKDHMRQGSAGPAHNNSWYNLNKSFKLYPSSGEESKPYSGYVPLTARISRLARSTLAKTILESSVTDETFAPNDEISIKEAKLRRTLARNSSGNDKPVILIVVVGGITYAEVTAIKKAFESGVAEGRKIVIASNCVMTGDDLVNNSTSSSSKSVV